MARKSLGDGGDVSPRFPGCVLGSLPFFLENLGRQECGRLPWDNGSLSCLVAAGPQTIGLGPALSCCPWPETDAQGPPASAPEVTSWTALSLEEEPQKGREANNGGFMPGARSPHGLGAPWGEHGLAGAAIVWGHEGLPGGLPAWRPDRLGLEALWLSTEDLRS